MTATQLALSPPALAHLLIVDSDPLICAWPCVSPDQFRVSVVSTAAGATRLIAHAPPVAVITEALLPDGSGLELCRAAKASTNSPAVLITTADPQQAPDAIDAGCDGVLLKPFPPNLLFARVGRVLRGRSEAHKLHQAALRIPSMSGRVELSPPTTHHYCRETRCPHCDRQGVTAFDFASYRRAWYACLTCRNVWQARRPE